MALDQSALLEVLDVLRTADAGERIAQACEVVYQALIDAGLTAKIGAALHESAGPPRHYPTATAGYQCSRVAPHADACLALPMFLTTGEFLPQHRDQRTLRLITAAEARGQQRIAEMNLHNLNNIITALDESSIREGE